MQTTPKRGFIIFCHDARSKLRNSFSLAITHYATNHKPETTINEPTNTFVSIPCTQSRTHHPTHLIHCKTRRPRRSPDGRARRSHYGRVRVYRHGIDVSMRPPPPLAAGRATGFRPCPPGQHRLRLRLCGPPLLLHFRAHAPDFVHVGLVVETQHLSSKQAQA